MSTLSQKTNFRPCLYLKFTECVHYRAPIIIILIFLFTASDFNKCYAHDATLTINRTQSDRIELDFSFDTISILQRLLAPRVDQVRFLIQYANMPAIDFEKYITKAKALLERELQIEGPGGTPFSIRPWLWPSSNEIQEILRQTAQDLLSDPTRTGQPKPLILKTSAVAKEDILRVHLLIGENIRPIFLIRPNIEQFWIDDLSPDAMLDF